MSDFLRINGITIDFETVESYAVTTTLESNEADRDGRGKVLKFFQKNRPDRNSYFWVRFDSEDECMLLMDWLDARCSASVVIVPKPELNSGIEVRPANPNPRKEK